MSVRQDDRPFLTAREAAAELNVSRATLYAYVSRGLIRSEPVQGSRGRRYRADDVRSLRRRKTPHPPGEAGNVLGGARVLDSRLTLIADGALYYRGRDAAALADAATLESTAGLLWRCGDRDPFATPPPAQLPLPELPAGIEACQAQLALAAHDDPRAYNLEPPGLARTGARLVRLLTACFTGAPPSADPVHLQLARAWGGDAAATELIRAALVLCADHELNASTFTVRVVASTRATPYAAVVAGLAALQGPRHGGMTARVAALCDEVAAQGNPRTAVAARLRRGDRLPGFGHPLYPNGDPRHVALERQFDRHGIDNHERQRLQHLAAAVAEATELRPNIDFSLVGLQRCFGLPPGAPIALFAIGRCVGWLAHAQEQYARPELIRPRARYIGEQPQPAHRPA